MLVSKPKRTFDLEHRQFPETGTINYVSVEFNLTVSCLICKDKAAVLWEPEATLLWSFLSHQQKTTWPVAPSYFETPELEDCEDKIECFALDKPGTPELVCVCLKL